VPGQVVRQVGSGRRLRRVAVAAGDDRVDQVFAARLLGRQDAGIGRSAPPPGRPRRSAGRAALAGATVDLSFRVAVAAAAGRTTGEAHRHQNRKGVTKSLTHEVSVLTLRARRPEKMCAVDHELTWQSPGRYTSAPMTERRDGN